ncbi:hypothetical protein PG988_005626 [Apiospora saccharicola]
MASRDIRRSIDTTGDATKAPAVVSQINGKAEPWTPSQGAHGFSASVQQQGIELEAYAEAVIVAGPGQDSLAKQVTLHGTANTRSGTSDMSGRRMSYEDATFLQRRIATNPSLSQAQWKATKPSLSKGQQTATTPSSLHGQGYTTGQRGRPLTLAVGMRWRPSVDARPPYLRRAGADGSSEERR